MHQGLRDRGVLLLTSQIQVEVVEGYWGKQDQNLDAAQGTLADGRQRNTMAAD